MSVYTYVFVWGLSFCLAAMEFRIDASFNIAIVFEMICDVGFFLC